MRAFFLRTQNRSRDGDAAAEASVDVGADGAVFVYIVGPSSRVAAAVAAVFAAVLVDEVEDKRSAASPSPSFVRSFV